MNIYDTANKLAQEIKSSEEYVNYKMAKQALNLNTELKIQMQEFEQKRYEVQIKSIQLGTRNEQEEKEIETFPLVFPESLGVKRL